RYWSGFGRAWRSGDTLAWGGPDCTRRIPSETGVAPTPPSLAGPSVMRPCPDSAALRLAFTRTETRTQRKSDGTVVIASRRFEVPDRFRHFTQLELRYASWDLSLVHLVDQRAGKVLCRLFPQNRAKTASALPRPRAADTKAPPAAPTDGSMPPLLKKLLKDQADSGLPPAYLPKDERDAS